MKLAAIVFLIGALIFLAGRKNNPTKQPQKEEGEETEE